MLTKNQLAATEHKDGPALVLAVPGAGKTTVLIHRTKKLISDFGVDPKKILSLTFSRASARDMKFRYLNTYPDYYKGVEFSTIHSFSFKIVNDYAKREKINYRLIEDSRNKLNKYEILRNIYRKYNHRMITEDQLESLINLIGYSQNMMLNKDQLTKSDIKNFPLIFESYNDYKRKHNLIDFDDMLLMAYEILKENANILNNLRDEVDYIQIDEGQDTSKIQLELVKLLAYPKNNLFIVADDDQSIYGFRGAYPEGLFDLKKEYPDIKIFFMEENFRSTKNIVKVSQNLIENNSSRFNKSIYTSNEFHTPINIVKLDSYEDQYKYILDDIGENDYEDIAILYRNNSSSIGLINYFYENDLDFYIRDVKLRFFSHWILKDIRNFLDFSQDLTNIKLYEKIFYKMKGYISKDMINYCRNLNSNLTVFERIKNYPDIPKYYFKYISELKRDFNRLNKMNISKAIDFIFNKLEYGDYLKETSNKFGHNYKALISIINQLKLISNNCYTKLDFYEKLENLRLRAIESSKNPKDITFSTIHSAKGLEFDAVFIIDLIDGEFPSTYSIEKSLLGDYSFLEEERRLFYVAITRAKNNLTLFSIDMIGDEIVSSSRFLDDLVN